MNNKKLKILLISPNFYYPENRDGINKINFNLLKENKYCEITFFHFYQTDALSKGFQNIKVISPSTQVSKRSKLKALLSKDPFNIIPKKEIVSFSNHINSISEDYDVIHIATLQLAHLVDSIIESDKIFFSSIDSLSLIMERKFNKQKSPIHKFLYFLELKKAKMLETLLYRKLKSAHFVSDVDTLYAQTNLGLETGFFIPNGINTEEFFDAKLKRNQNEVIFTGNFDYAPNRDTANFIINKIAPLALRNLPNITFILAGGSPSQEMLNCSLSNVKVTGRVPSLSPYLQKSNIFISPIFSGAGIKNKVLEAMASGLKCLCSELSIDGIEKPINYSIVKGNNPEVWLAELKLLIEKEIVSSNDLQEFHDFYSWKNIHSRYYKAYLECCFSPQKS